MTRHLDTTSADPTQVATLRLSGPDELLQAIPYLLGFHPHESVVLVGLSGARLVVTARLDLADADERTLQHTVGSMTHAGASEVVGAVYAADVVDVDGPLPHTEVTATLSCAASAAGSALTDVLFVSGGRWWSYVCADGDCCPREGRPLDLEGSSVAAAATYAGLVALPDRGALEETLEALPWAEREALTPLIEQAEHAAVQAVLDARREQHDRSVKRAIFAAARRFDKPRGDVGVTDEQAVRFSVALTDPLVRDAVWIATDSGRLDGRALWLDLARRLPVPYDAPALFLYAWASWRAGNGALARTAAQRAVASDPGYSAADLLLAALSGGVDPKQVPRLRRR